MAARLESASEYKSCSNKQIRSHEQMCSRPHLSRLVKRNNKFSQPKISKPVLFKPVHPKSNKGQMESSFQWVYVIIAGGSFLLIFFMLFRSCSSAGEIKQDAQAITATATALSSVGWQSNLQKNFSVPEVSVLCPVGSLTLHSTGAKSIDKPIDRVPIFFSSNMGGLLRVIMRNISIDMGSSGSISYGTVGYAIDANTYYFLIKDDDDHSSAFSQGKKFYESINGTNIKFVKYDSLEVELNKIPSSAHGVVIVAFDARNTDTIDSLIANIDPKITFVRLQGNSIEFFKKSGTRLVSEGSTTNIDSRFALGAIVSGDKVLYLCTKNVILERARKITIIYGLRAEQIARSESPALSDNCKELYGKYPGGINTTLFNLNKQSQTNPDAYLAELLHPTTTRYLQDDAYSSSCPVIA